MHYTKSLSSLLLLLLLLLLLFLSLWSGCSAIDHPLLKHSIYMAQIMAHHLDHDIVVQALLHILSDHFFCLSDAAVSVQLVDCYTQFRAPS
jgi:hypothetical protein